MYPNGVSIKQLKWATEQIENTLNGLNCKNEEFKKLKIDNYDLCEEYKSKIKDLNEELKAFQYNTFDLHEKIKRLENPISIDNNDIQERLELLDALEAGGVDNWQWYDESINQYKDNK
ncbi:MAG: hypothetical protein GQ540_03855 [Lutibacter sp.]|uniref:hypothetical protein n=1 Tax=Lutibacter sp. TaxID=1925666 RepID=UPI0019F3101F|nr:hypothetical protein [Lutibacter sp.]NOR27648.1 hypothetical protein [Lutibacter sp.]